MTALQEINLGGNGKRLALLTASIRDAEDGIKNAEERLERIDAQIAAEELLHGHNTKLVELALQSTQGYLRANHPARIAMETHIKAFPPRRALAFLREDKAALLAKQTFYADNLVGYRREYKTLSGRQKTLKVSTIKEILSAFPTIPKRYIKIIEDSQGRPCLRWRFKGLVMSPNYNPYWRINDGKKAYVPLQEIVVLVNLQTNKVTIAPVRGQRDECPYGFSGRRVHPHILQHDVPCFGDFAAPLAEALDDGDVEIIATVIQLFLQSVEPDDTAGKYWPNWLNTTIKIYQTDKEHDQTYAENTGTSPARSVFHTFPDGVVHTHEVTNFTWPTAVFAAMAAQAGKPPPEVEEDGDEDETGVDYEAETAVYEASHAAQEAEDGGDEELDEGEEDFERYNDGEQSDDDDDDEMEFAA